jgi:hypothetical protein
MDQEIFFLKMRHLLYKKLYTIGFATLHGLVDTKLSTCKNLKIETTYDRGAVSSYTTEVCIVVNDIGLHV